MTEDFSDYQSFLQSAYGIAARLTPLPGEHDLNFRATAADGQHYLLKLHAAASDAALIDMQTQVLRHLAAAAPALPVSRHIAAKTGDLLVGGPGGRTARLLTWLDGEVWARSAARSARSAAELGHLLGGLDLALATFRHPALGRDYGWDIGRAHLHRPLAATIADEAKRAAVSGILERFEQQVLPQLGACPRQAIHNDANDYNVLLGGDGSVTGLLDFGDMVETWRIVELAVACTYALIGADDPVGAILPLVEAYHAANPIGETEADLVFDLIKTRCAVSICMATKQIRETPDNRYLLISQDDVWRELQRLERENGALARMRIRDACGFAAVPTAARVVRWLEAHSHTFAPVIMPEAGRPQVTVFDFSATSPDAAAIAALDGSGLDRFCADRIAAAGAHFGVGRYGENRTIYKGSAFETTAPHQRRTMHIGIDLFAPDGVAVHAPFDGTVAFTHDDAVAYGFGPTVLLEHVTTDGAVFWTLYGHLSRAALAGLSIGQRVRRGEAFATFGARFENGEWPPHLHFQIVTDHLGLGARMHGVGVLDTWQIWREISPDPSVVLGLPVSCTAIAERSTDWLVRQRHRRIGRSLSIAYGDAPLKIVAGEGATLIDEAGGRWLDMVNNVCHVGHCHPRVVEAGQRQMARLNTNSRYLHDTLVEYADRLTALFPAPLKVCFFVNSGSEANDLAIRLARAYTGRRDIITVDHAYHGHLTSLIDVSPYKFAGRGGEGRPAHVQVAEMPDPYRGRVRGLGRAAGEDYASDVARRIEDLAAEHRAPSLFFSEGILGTGGQIVLPDGYLQAAYGHVRRAGGLCLADEVQVGFGRVGSHMWAFETQGVVPDIVTLGKPIGNGHPMAAVITTPAIASAFANGMEYFNTFGGNPVSAAIGLAVLDVIRDERLRHNCHVVGERLLAGARRLAESHPLIGEVRGCGLFDGIELVRDRSSLAPAAAETDFVIGEMKRRHRILLSSEGPLHNVLKIKPPAVFSLADCDRFLAALDDVLGRAASYFGSTRR